MNLFLNSSFVEKKLNKVGPVNIAQALGPYNNHIDNNNNTQSDRHFETIFWANLDKYFSENLTSNYITITFLKTKDEKLIRIFYVIMTGHSLHVYNYVGCIIVYEHLI